VERNENKTQGETLKTRTIKSALWKLLERGGHQFIALIVQIVLARILEPHDFGTIAILLVFINLANVFVQSGLNTALIRAKEVDDDDYSPVFTLSLVIAALLYVVLYFASPALEDFYGLPRLTVYLRVLAILLFINALNCVQVAIVSREMKFHLLFRATMISSVLSGIVGIVAALAGLGVWALVAQQICAQLFSNIVLAIKISWSPRLLIVKLKAVQHLKFGWKLLAASLLNTIYTNLYDLIIGRIFSASILGFFNQGKKIPTVLESLFDSAISTVMLSSAAKVQESPKTVRALMRRAMQASTFFVVPCMALLIACAEPLICIVFTEKWLDSAPFLQLFAASVALVPITKCNLQVLNALGRSDVVLRLEVIKKCIAVSILLFTSFVVGDIYAIAIGNLVYSLIAIPINTYPLSKMLDYSIPSQLKDVLPSVALSIVAGFSCYLVGILFESAWMKCLVGFVAFGVVYLCLGKLFKLEALDYLLSTAKEMRMKSV